MFRLRIPINYRSSTRARFTVRDPVTRTSFIAARGKQRSNDSRILQELSVPRSREPLERFFKAPLSRCGAAHFRDICPGSATAVSYNHPPRRRAASVRASASADAEGEEWRRKRRDTPSARPFLIARYPAGSPPLSPRQLLHPARFLLPLLLKALARRPVYQFEPPYWRRVPATRLMLDRAGLARPETLRLHSARSEELPRRKIIKTSWKAIERTPGAEHLRIETLSVV